MNGTGYIGVLSVSGYVVITDGRVLQNVTADAGIITSGQLGLGRMPRGTSGYVLEAQGAGFDPMYVDPNGRYGPASHVHSHSSLTGVGPDDHHARDHTHAGETISPDTINVNTLNVAVTVNCKNWSHADILFENDFRITEAENLNLGHGLAFLNPDGRVMMLLDGRGNVEILGRLREKSSRFKGLCEKMTRKSRTGVA